MNWRRGMVWMIFTLLLILGASAVYKSGNKAMEIKKLSNIEIAQLPIEQLDELSFDELVVVTNRFNFKEIE